MNDKSLPTVGKLYRLKPERPFVAQGRLLENHEHVLVLKAEVLPGAESWVNVLLFCPTNGSTGVSTFNRHQNNMFGEITLDTGYPPDNTGWGYWFEEVT